MDKLQGKFSRCRKPFLVSEMRKRVDSDLIQTKEAICLQIQLTNTSETF